MSYSYIKSVFPKFEYSTVYDDKLYKNLNMEFKPGSFLSHYESSVSKLNDTRAPAMQQISQPIVQQRPVQSSMQDSSSSIIAPSHLLESINPFNVEFGYAEVRKPEVKRELEMFEQEASAKVNQPSGLRIYQQPIINNNIPEYNNIDIQGMSMINPMKSMNNSGNKSGMGVKETFDDQDHDLYIKHVMGCNICKQRLLKQFNIETERMRNDEIMELISYVMFGVFILILLDSLKK